MPRRFLFRLGSLSGLGCIALGACDGTAPVQQRDRLRVATTTTIIEDIVRQVGGEHVAVSGLLPQGADAHAFQPTPGDARRLADARLIFVNGAGLEGGPLRALVENATATRVVALASAEVIPMLGFDVRPLPAASGGGADDDVVDPHVWMDPTLVAAWAERVAVELAQADAARAQQYHSRGALLAAELGELDRWAAVKIASVPAGRRVLLADHHVFGYFAARYGFQVRQSIEPSVTTAAEPSARELAALRDALVEAPVPAVFVGASRSARLAEALVEGLGIVIVRVRTSTLGTDGVCPAPRYQEFFRCNVMAIVAALR